MMSTLAIVLFPHYSGVVALAITSISSIIGTLWVLGSIVRAKCTEYLKWNLSKDRVTVIGRTFIILACTVHLIFVFLVALDVNSKANNYQIMNHLGVFSECNRWAPALLLIVGTILLVRAEQARLCYSLNLYLTALYSDCHLLLRKQCWQSRQHLFGEFPPYSLHLFYSFIRL